MGWMFSYASKFNQPLSLDTSSVTTMYAMFYSASAFNQPLSLDTSSVTDMSFMFYSASAFNQPLSLDTSSVTDMSVMFKVRSSPCPAPNLQSSPSCTLLAPRSSAASRAAPRPARYALLSTLGRARRRSTSR